MLKIRDGYTLVIDEANVPHVLFDDKEICMVMWYPIHPTKDVGYIFEQVFWHPRATARNKLEAPVFFAQNCGVKLMGWSRKHDRKFFKVLEKHGLIKHTGFSDIVFDDQRAKAWETV